MSKQAEAQSAEGFVKGSRSRVYKKRLKSIIKNWQLYALAVPLILYFIIFKYIPIYGLQIAFKDFNPADGILGSEWIGFEQFEKFFNSFHFWRMIKNTLFLNLYQLAVFPISVIVALSFNELRNGRFKKWTQTITYAPHFISLAVLVGMLIQFLHPETGLVNLALQAVGIEPINFMESPGWFKTVFVASDQWQQLGWGAIIFLAALTAVDPQQHEAATVDGATRFQRIIHINIPAIMPTIIVLLILQLGHFMTLGFQKVLLMQNPLNIESSQILQTYVYETGIVDAQYSFAAAIGFFDAIINLILVVIFNQLAKKTGTSLW